MGVHWSQSSRKSRNKLKSEAGRGFNSSAESIGVRVLERGADPAQEKSPEESIGVQRSQSSTMSRDKLQEFS